jgi:CBS domain containing-hemolysin-like protein
MIIYGLGFALLLVAFLALALQRLYSSVPARELKRLAGRGDHLARSLYRVAAYGAGLRVLLWATLGVSLTVSFLLLIPILPSAAGFALLVVASAVLFVWLPSLRLTVHSARFATWFVSPLAGVLSRAYPFLDRVARIIGQRRGLAPHSRLYEKEDLHWLLNLQRDQADNRIRQEELELMQRALDFPDRQAAEVVQPRDRAHLVNADDTIGPVLLDQLHKSRQSSFLVYKDKKENIVGSLSMQDAVKAKQGGRVFDLVRSDLVFVHEDFSLRDVMTAFQKTGQQVAIVINGFEEFIGLITLEGLISELLGASEESDIVYENRSAVAAFTPPKKQQETSNPPSPEATEVVE